MARSVRLACIAAVALGLISCGGGGSDVQSNPVATFALTVSVAGTAVAGLSLAPGQAGSASAQDGQTVRLDSTAAVTVTPSTSSASFGAATVASTSWSAAVSSFSSGTVTLLVALASDPTKTATLTINVGAHRFDAVAHVVNDVVDWNEADSFSAIADQTVTYSIKVKAVSADGSYSTGLLGSGFDETRTIGADGNTLTRLYNASGNLCSFTPKRDFFHFPVYVGQTWGSAYSYSCQAGYRESATVDTVVEAYEPVTVPAGTFPALRIKRTVAFTSSNDANLTNGAAGMGAYQYILTCWWAVGTGRDVKCTAAYTYVGTSPANYLKSYVQDATFVGNR